MKRLSPFYVLLIGFMLALTTCVHAEIKIIKLSYASPDAFISTITQLFGNNIKAAPAPSINAIVINCEDPAILKEIEKLAAELDRKPAVLRFSVQRDADSSQNNSTARFGNRGKFMQTQSSSHESGTNTVVAVEYRKAQLTEDSVRIFSFPGYYGDESQAITISHGLMVSGHLTGQNVAQLEIWYSSGKELDSETLLTSLSVPIGQWVSIGGSSDAKRQKNPSLSIGNKSEIGQTKSGGYIDRRYLIKVDLVRY